MHLSHPVPRGTLIRLLLLLVVVAATAFTLLGGDKVAVAGNNPNSYDCRGHMGKGAPSPDAPDSTEVQYVFACSGPITGYQIQPDHAVTSFETEVFATDKVTKDVVPTDAFSCQGSIPGFGVNCTGTYQGNYENVTGQFTIDEALCAEPRVDSLLTVMYAYKDAKGNVAQAIAGPFELGRPRGCPKSARGGKTRIPQAPADEPAT